MKIKVRHKRYRETSDAERLSFTDWMKKYRPDGYGYVGVQSFNEKTGSVETLMEDRFTEVICDYCNADIPPSVKIGEADVETQILTIGTYSICEQCASEYEAVAS